MRLVRSLISVVSLAALPLFAAIEPVSKDAGTVAFPFLRLAVDARSAAMGGVSVAMPTSPFSYGENPGGAAFAERTQAGVSYNPQMYGVTGLSFGVNRPLPKNSVIGMFVTYVSAGTFDTLLDEAGLPLAGDMSITPYDIAGGIGWSRNFQECIGAGVLLKGIYSVVNPGVSNTFGRASSDAFALDAGAQYRWDDQLTFAAAVHNLGFIRSNYSDDLSDAKMPFSLVTGLSYQTKRSPRTLWAVDLEKMRGTSLTIRAGTEIAVHPQYLKVRIGSNIQARDIRAIAAHVSGSDEGSMLVKSDWEFLTLGLGAVVPGRATSLALDAAVRLRRGALPGVNVALTAGF